jgi:ABC-type Na+ efflux pump permease subunit
MINLVLQKFKEQRSSILYYALGLFGYTWLMIGMFPSMQKADMEQLTKSMPEEFMKFFGGDGFLAYSKIEGFLSLEYLGFFFILIIAFYIGSSAGSAIAGPIEKRTIDFELSQPISRIRYAFGSFILGLKASALLVIFNAFVIWALCEAYNININNKGIVAFVVTAVFFVWAIYGIA